MWVHLLAYTTATPPYRVQDIRRICFMRRSEGDAERERDRERERERERDREGERERGREGERER